MGDLNLTTISIIVSLIIRLFAIGVIVFYIIPRQILEVVRPRDWLTGLRWQILLLFVFSVISAIPALYYQYLRAMGYDPEILRNIAGILSNLSSLGNSILLLLIYNYRMKDQ